MLQHISVDLGLDDLYLLDLRDLDPPPALGANMLMVIGTARSEKHLHVSADRLCRWLRTTHRLTPYADGLLGRGELRLKLKRKNRRARMLNSVGASDSSNTDDGIRTGWVCVNIGMVEDGRGSLLKAVELQDDNYVGFGGETSGVKVVVQMLTEEKREELDLETLWSQALARYTRRKDRIAKGQIEETATSDHLGPSLGFNASSSTLSLAP
ncbi:ATPase synthesis protein 25 mitochondrial [Xanthoria calcicola]